MIIFAILYICILLLVYALCKVASEEDKYSEFDKEKGR